MSLPREGLLVCKALRDVSALRWAENESTGREHVPVGGAHGGARLPRIRNGPTAVVWPIGSSVLKRMHKTTWLLLAQLYVDGVGGYAISSS